MRLFGFGGRKADGPALGRGESLSARPVLNSLVKLERGQDGNTILQVPRRDGGLVRSVSRWFHLPPYKRIALDELGTFVIELCDGRHTVREMVRRFAREFRLNEREAEVGITTFLRTLARRSVIALVIEGGEAPER